MKRRMFITLAFAAAVLSIALVGLWVRSYIVRDSAGVWFVDRRVAGIISSRGSMTFAWILESRPTYGFIWTTRQPEDLAGTLGFGWKTETGGALLSLPHWCLILITGGIAWWSRRRARSLFHIPGTCEHCGYDLRASPERCPECGTIATARRDGARA